MLTTPYNKFVPVTLDDAVDIPTGSTHAIYVGGAGNVVAVQENNVAVTFTGVPAGTLLPIRVKRINNTLTTATAILALYVT